MALKLRGAERARTHQVDGAVHEGPFGAAPGSVVGVTGAVGAPGRTFLSVNLAFGLARLGRRVVLVDADPHLGAVAVQLDLAEDRSLNFLAHDATLRPIDDELLARHLQTSRGLDVLTGRSSPAAEPSLPLIPERLLSLLRQRYQVILIDVGALDCRAAQETALACQLLVWVAVPTKLGTDLLDRTLSGPLAAEARTRPSMVLLNRIGALGLRDADRSLRQRWGMAVVAALPEHRKACLAAEDGGTPAVLRGPLSSSLRRCAQALEAALPQPTEQTAWDGSPAPAGFISEPLG